MRRGAGTSAPVWSPREREVLDLIARGRTNGEIAEALGISFATAKWHVSELISKLGVQSREEVAGYWRQERGFGGHVRGFARALTGVTVLKLAAGGALGVAAVAGILLVVVGPGPDASPGGASDPLGGFDHPRTVHLAPDGRLVIADLGTGNNDGQVVAVDLQDGRRTVLMSHLPSTQQDGGGLAGPSAAGVNRDGTVCAVIGGADRPGGGFAALHCSNGLGADFRQFEEEHNPDGRGIASNPYDIVPDESRGWYVSDSAANAVFHVDQFGAVSVAGVLSRFCCLADQRGEAAPAGMDYLANGRGTIRVLTIALFGGAAATLRAGDPEVGLRMAALPRLIAVIDDGKDAYFLVHDDGALEPNSGRIVDSLKRDVVTGLDRPTGFARLPDGRFVVAEEARGRVRIAAAK